jgi:hypothetical protein
MLDSKEIHDLAPSLHIASQNEQLWIGNQRLQLDNTTFSDLNFEFASDEAMVKYFVNKIDNLPIGYIGDIIQEILVNHPILFFDLETHSLKRAESVCLNGSSIQLNSEKME